LSIPAQFFWLVFGVVGISDPPRITYVVRNVYVILIWASPGLPSNLLSQKSIYDDKTRKRVCRLTKSSEVSLPAVVASPLPTLILVPSNINSVLSFPAPGPVSAVSFQFVPSCPSMSCPLAAFVSAILQLLFSNLKKGHSNSKLSPAVGSGALCPFPQHCIADDSQFSVRGFRGKWVPETDPK
jgi:hypothetical protein